VATPSWLNPALALQIGTMVAMMGTGYGVITNQLQSDRQKNAEFRADVILELREIRGQNQISAVTRAQVEALKDRVATLERFQSDQTAYNLKFLTAIASQERRQ
jgi:hypothetical protein